MKTKRVAWLRQGEVRLGANVESGEFTACEFGESGGRDHRCVVRGKAGRGEVDGPGEPARARPGTQTRVAGHAAADDDAMGAAGLGTGSGAGEQFANDRMLK